EHAGVEQLRPERLHERIQLLVESLLADAGVDRVAEFPPVVERGIEVVLLRRLDAAVDRDPGHDLRMDEVLPRTANLPDAFVRLFPEVLDALEQGPPDGP